MKKEVLNALNEQINFELYSGYIYLNLSIAMERENYKGYAKWLANHYKEELAHADQFIEFIQKRDAKPELMPIEMKNFDVKEPLEVAKIILDHENKVTERIYKIHDVAKKSDDYATEIFMHQFINEQIEEEELALDIVDNFTLAGDNIAAKITIDRELGSK
ncbi:ferritin [Peptostreptococcaceae bacterium oral taxon 929]|nr:ferritin [Peptostreptococcaceae bacterium oral taxon 929]OFK80365.1 hypothetical protein HMPREF2800_03790 [Anaerosphaera sp. HMSC064C01]